MIGAYYNEFDPFAAAWLRALIAKGLIPDGEVDERSILDVDADDLRGFRQCHFFSGIGGWPYALRLAGFDDDAEVWTGSCPCQPLSVAGKQKGADDERHLWPAFYGLIAKRKPAIVFGEQVAGALGCEWLAGVRADLEEIGYACGAADLCAAGVGAPHIRSRLYWSAVGNADAVRQLQPQGRVCDERGWIGDASSSRVGNADDARLQGHGRSFRQHDAQGRQEPNGCSAASGVGDMADADQGERRWWARYGERFAYEEDAGRPQGHREPAGGGQDGFWSDAEWREGADGKARRVKPGLSLLAHGLSNRVGRLRGYGNAIVPQVGAAFVQAMMEALP